ETDYTSKYYNDLLDELNELHHHYEVMDVATIEKQVELVLKGLGFDRNDLYRPVEEFSGGWQMRIELAKILLRKPALILLDEPTNHLDIESIQWLENYLTTYPDSVMIVSHDRKFLDNATNRTIEIVNKKVYDYSVPYTRFTELRKERIEQQKNTLKNQEKYIEHTEQLIEKFRYKASKAKFAQSLIHKLEKMDKVELDDEETASIRFRFPQPPRSGKQVVEMEALTKKYSEKIILENINLSINRGDKIAFVGRNGEGKSTLSRIIAGIESYNGELTIGSNVIIGYYAQNQADSLDGDDTVFEIIDKAATGDIRTKVRNLLGTFLFSGDSVYKKVKVLSGGEKSRLALCKLLLEPQNLLILDEPTNHLDMRSKDVLKNALLDFEGTVILVSHDRDFLQGLTNRVFEFRDKKIKEFIGDIYDYLESKKIESLQQLELKVPPKKQENTPAEIAKPDYNNKKNKERDFKKLQKAVEKAEADIAVIEGRLSVIEEQLKDPAFYVQNKNNAEVFSEYESVKKQLAVKMNEWEINVEQLEKLTKDNSTPT
ncbi:MAG: ABC-F family ATP-binding cassette domain-containing protein, partial [Chitinophagales bacterium]